VSDQKGDLYRMTLEFMGRRLLAERAKRKRKKQRIVEHSGGRKVRVRK
jgi:hypothetical protein